MYTSDKGAKKIKEQFNLCRIGHLTIAGKRMTNPEVNADATTCTISIYQHTQITNQK